MKRTMTARRSVKSHKTGVFERDGKVAAKTCGIVSPTMMQKASMPPNALYMLVGVLVGPAGLRLQGPLGDGDGNEARPAIAVFHGGLEGVCAAELRICDNEADGPVHRDGEGYEQD